MRRLLAVASLAVASAAGAQSGVPLVSSAPYNAGSNDSARFVGHGGEPFFLRSVTSATVVRAGAWGRCVVAASPALSRAYVRTRSADAALKPVFTSCLRQTGDFTFSNWGDIRRAALSDALARL